MFKDILNTEQPIIISNTMITDTEKLLTYFFMNKLENIELNDFMEIPIKIFPVIQKICQETNYRVEIIDKNDFVVICTKEMK